MKPHKFSLRPFREDELRFEPVITGHICRQSNMLGVYYELRGPLDEFAVPAAAEIPARKNSLWEETCFEFFLAQKN